MSEKQTPYLKTPHVLKILNNESVSCEEKLTNIKNLIDGNKLTIAPSGAELPSGAQNTEVTSSAPVTTPSQSAIEKIVDEIKGGKEKQYALSLLNEIDRSDYISFNPETLEIIVDGETIKFSNVKNLVQYCISAAPSQMPLAIAIFIQCMIRIKVPHELLRHGDAQALRESLIKIDELKGKGSASDEVAPHVVGDSASSEVVTPEGSSGERSESSDRGKKRALEEDENAIDESVTLNPAKKLYGLEKPSLDKIRTNPKLRDAISEKWHDVMTKATPTSRSRKRKASLAFPKSAEEEEDEWYDAKKPAIPTSKSRKRKAALAFPDSVEEESDRWYDANRTANPSSRSKKRQVTLDVQ